LLWRWAISATHSPTVREREQHASIEDADAIEPRAAFNDQTAARRDHLRHMGQEHPGQRVGRAKSDRQVHPDRPMGCIASYGRLT
jgi:hypothetical protein